VSILVDPCREIGASRKPRGAGKNRQLIFATDLFFPVSTSPRPSQRMLDVGSNISNTRKSVSSGYPNTETWVEKMTRSRVFLNRLRGVWISDQTLFRVLDMVASQTIRNS